MKKLQVIRLTPEERKRMQALAHNGRVAANERRNAQMMLFTDQSEGGPGLPVRGAAQRAGATRQTVENVRRRCVQGATGTPPAAAKAASGTLLPGFSPDGS